MCTASERGGRAGQTVRAVQRGNAAHALRLTGLIDFNNAPVGDFLYEAEEGCLVVPQAGVLIARADVVYADGLARQGGADQPLPKVL